MTRKRIGMGFSKVILFATWLLAGASLAAQGDAAEQLRTLNEGYSMLYTSVSGLGNVDKALLVKFENDETQRVVTDTTTVMSELAAQLEQLATNYPDLDLKLMPLPAIERKSQAAATAARIKSFAPVVGRTGADFERTLLLTLGGGLNQLRHLARVMVEAERSTQRRKFLSDAEDRMDKSYGQIQQLLNAQYFTHNTYADDN